MYPDMYSLALDKEIPVRDSFRRECEEMVWKDIWVINLDEDNLRCKKEIRARLKILILRDSLSDK